MKITFLSQGYEAESKLSVGKLLTEFLSRTNFHSFTGISAFASEAGIKHIGEYITIAKENFDSLTLVVGVDQEGTSKEALEEILNLNINSFIFYQVESPIFHPKIYLFEGKKETKLIIGSSNLTKMGLFGNVESSLLVEFSNGDIEGEDILSQLKEYYKGLFEFNDPNLFEINKTRIDDFILKGIVPNETDRLKKYGKQTEKQKANKSDNGLKIPRRAVAKIPREKHREKELLETGPVVVFDKNANSIMDKSDLLWQSGPLTQRDLNIPDGKNTNPTGSMLFKKGMSKGIDQRHFFRDSVFSSLNWARDTNAKTPHLERAIAKFYLIVDGKNYGAFNLLITHNSNANSRSYEQKNSMTQISWGEAKKIIAKNELIGKSASLYGTDNESEFILSIE